jgi:hypothetical protein
LKKGGDGMSYTVSNPFPSKKQIEDNKKEKETEKKAENTTSEK